MKEELSSLELKYIVEEMQPLLDGKIDKVFQPDKKELLLQIHKTGLGKKFIRITPKFIYLASSKIEVPLKPPGFCSYLRKKLGNARIREIQQKDFERIVIVVLETKDLKYNLVIELFNKGNVILCDENFLILSPMELQRWENRDILPRKPYVFPKSEINVLELDEAKLTDLAAKTKQDSLIKFIASDVTFGGMYGKEILAEAKLDEKQHPNKLKDKEIKLILKLIKAILKKKKDPQVVMDKEKTKDIVPFSIETFSKSEKKHFETYNEALDSVLTEKVITEKSEEKEKTKRKASNKYEVIIKAQEKQIKKLEDTTEKNHRKGEIIYENFQKIETIIKELKELRKKHSWKEIKEKVEGHDIIKKIDDVKGRIILEIE
ncbi:NFACT family protein [Nanoarchaeota archaeon]